MKFLIEAEVVEKHPEGLVIVAVDNGFGAPQVQFAPGKLVPYQEPAK